MLYEQLNQLLLLHQPARAHATLLKLFLDRSASHLLHFIPHRLCGGMGGERRR